MEKVEELAEQLKQERQRALALEGQLNTSTLSLQTLDKVSHLSLHAVQSNKTHSVMHYVTISSLQLQERIADVERERDLIKENYDTLLKT